MDSNNKFSLWCFMVNVPYVQAVSYHKTMTSGRNMPSLFTCRDSVGERCEYVVKFHSRLGANIIFELIGVLLGNLLDIPIPPAAIIEIDSQMASSIPDPNVSRLIENDPGPHFGSQFMTGGYAIYNRNTYLSDVLQEQIINIFAFDMFIQNYDRTFAPNGKPNLLYKGDELVVIDHELAFAFAIPPRPTALPWEIRKLNLASQHIFFHTIKTLAEKSELTFASFIEKFDDISVESFQRLTEAVPIEWYNESYIDSIIAHFDNVRNNIDLFEKGLLEVFA